jgi:hypothetical protein
MAKRVFIDIETLPPDRNALAHISRDCFTDEEFRRLALDGNWGRVLTVGVIAEQDGVETARGLLGRERQTMRFHLDEARTLRGFWKLLRNFDTRRDLLIGHNVFDFDLLFLYKRSVVQRVQPSISLSFARYRSAPVFDTMHEWNKWSPRKFISLDELAKVLGLESSKTDGMNGCRVYEKFCAGCHDEIARYCMRDVELVRRIYHRMAFEFDRSADDR